MRERGVIEMKVRQWPIWIVVAALLSGCAGRTAEVNKASVALDDEQLYSLGLEKLASKKCTDARSLLRQLELRNPKGEMAPNVKIALADSYLCENTVESRAEGIAAYRSFLSFYPKHPKACHAQLQIALYHYRQMEKADRDQTETRNAISEFQKLLVSYPECESAEEARVKLDLCFERLADSELKVGDYYFKLKKNRAALGRYQYILENYYKYPLRDKVLYRLHILYDRLGDNVRSDQMKQQLADEFPESPYLQGKRKRAKPEKD